MFIVITIVDTQGCFCLALGHNMEQSTSLVLGSYLVPNLEAAL